MAPLTLSLLFASLSAHAADPPECDRWSGPGGPPSVVQDEDCIASPPIGTFNPVVEWNWAGHTTLPQYKKVMMTPAVGNLTDDNGDGKVGTKDTPDIVFTTYEGANDYRSPGAVVAISGDGSKTHWMLESPGGYDVYGAGGVAIGDIDNDGRPDVCVAGAEVSVICLDGNGAFKWAAGDEPYIYGSPAIADMNRDGKPEIVFGRLILDNKGNVLGQGSNGDGRNYMSVPVDWDGDGNLEVMAGNAVYEMDGSVDMWITGDNSAPTSMYDGDGIPAIGDMDGDGWPDVVKTEWGEVVAIDNMGYELWRAPIPGGGNGGSPTIADFDGDGRPDVGLAGYDAYGVYDNDGDLLWERPVHDHSSNVTGSSVYDFEGDGIAEVVYADEYTLWIFRGYDGKVLMESDDHASATLYEYPVIADVDGDGSTEIVVASNNYGNKGITGITVIGDADNSWFPARPIWNQFAYHITNVNNDGSIPKVQKDNWLTWNNFRAGGTELGPSHWLAQLYPTEPDMCLTDCSAKAVEIYLPVSNSGLLDASNFEIAFYRRKGGVDTRVATFTASYLSGGAADMFGPYVISEADWSGGDLFAVVDDLDTARECNELDNKIELGPWPYPDTDVDGDGFEPEECGGSDCDDTEFEINPDAVDIPDNGIDEDCSGADRPSDLDCDEDGDGYEADSPECGGDDCDDGDQHVNPSETDIPEDGIDQDCDGADNIGPGEGDLKQTCGCSAGPTAFGGAWLPLLGLLGSLVRRRRAGAAPRR